MNKETRKIKSIGMCTLLFIPLLMTVNAEAALQTKPIGNNQTVNADVAANNKTRLFVSGNRISALRGTPDAYTYVNDEVNGQVFITPTLPFKKKPFSLFVTTEQGNTYGLILTPQKALSDSIMLVPNPPKETTQNLLVDDTQKIIQLLRAMVTMQPAQGVTPIKIKEPPNFVLNKEVRIQLQSVFQTTNWSGQIYQVTNISNQPMQLQEKQFFKPSVRAIAFSTRGLRPHGSALMYVVKSGVVS